MTSSSPCDPPDPGSARPRPRPGLVRMRRRRRRTVLLGLVLLIAVVGAVALARAGDPARRPPSVGPGPMAYGADQRTEPTGYPRAGAGSFAAAAGESPIVGADGPLHRYRVAVERGTGQDVPAFAAAVDEVLADPRGWTAGGERRVQRVADAEVADFTIYLATPRTSELMCAEGGLSTEGYTSCRLPGKVIINLARWLEAVPDYGAPLEVYRAYVVNHEVGHEFGEGHEACPGPGRPAPVMQQQTYGLQGCVAYAWPWLAGRRYAGEIVP
ncbi:hypothetical protein DLJ47_25905 [Micromonospora sp. S4605]|nr:DUF3152 domain-containing protein [Micromonospora sp. S4605]PWU49613.1 hypothetical protein DLJ47_25905 [Micromonospora sp. S4605]